MDGLYQIVPSSVASGSCGLDPGVGVVHSLNETCAGPETISPWAFGLSGIFRKIRRQSVELTI
jgi:hypothetical protein